MTSKPEKQYTIKVNGVEFEVGYEKLVASDVLKLAVDQKAIGGDPENFVLISNDPIHEFKHDDWVDFSDYKDFTAEKSAPTPVAEARYNE